MRGRLRMSRTSWLLKRSTTSPLRMPAAAAGAPSCARAMRAPRVPPRRPRLSAISSVTCWMFTPSQPRRTRPLSASCVTPPARGWRDREADADRAARGRIDGGVDADHLAAQVEQRPAGIAAVDGGIGLDEIVEWPLADVAASRAHDASGGGAAQPEGVADGQHPVAHIRCVGIAPGHEGSGAECRTRSTAMSVRGSVPTSSARSVVLS
jgi:hypothetical protein